MESPLRLGFIRPGTNDPLMNPNDHNESANDRVGHRSSILATEGWHRFITVICLLVCVGLVLMGASELIDTAGRRSDAKSMDYLRGAFFVVLGIQGVRFLIRQLRGHDAQKVTNGIESTQCRKAGHS